MIPTGIILVWKKTSCLLQCITGEIENPVVTSDFRSVSLELARSTETVSGFLKSMSSAEEAKKRAFEKAKEERLKFADLQKQGSKVSYVYLNTYLSFLLCEFVMLFAYTYFVH